MSDMVRAIARTEAVAALEGLTNATIEDRFRTAFKATQNHWMATDPDVQMHAAIEAVYLGANEEEREQIEAEMRALRTLSAAIQGIPVDFTRLEAAENPIGIGRLYREVTAENGGSAP